MFISGCLLSRQLRKHIQVSPIQRVVRDLIQRTRFGWKLVLVKKGLAHKYSFEIYNAERLPVIPEILDIPTLILNTIPFMFDINCRFSNISVDTNPIWGVLETCDTSVMRSAVILSSSTSVTPVASPAGLVLLDQEDYTFSAYLMEAG
ncbi:hypothetical protein C8R48DRAFT_772871 [Suillus tomentosus]|nr:hypothetical protein C8R48DRAFT_772871 [Suillus tomentosus]